MLHPTRITVLVSSVALGAGLLLFVSEGVARADDYADEFPYRGFIWFANYYDNARLFFTSDMCSWQDDEGKYVKNTEETTFGVHTKSSTFGKEELQRAWPSGINVGRPGGGGNAENSSCSHEAFSIAHDFKLIYDANFATTHGSYGGEHHRVVADESYCTFWDFEHPCGMHGNYIHINKQKYQEWNSQMDADWNSRMRVRLLLHEVGHTYALQEHCTSDAIMNDGTAGCNGGAWLNVMGYQATDRRGIAAVYPCNGGLSWPCQYPMTPTYDCEAYFEPAVCRYVIQP